MVAVDAVSEPTDYVEEQALTDDDDDGEDDTETVEEKWSRLMTTCK